MGERHGVPTQSPPTWRLCRSHLVPRRGSSPPSTIDGTLARHTVRALTNARCRAVRAHSHSTASASAWASGVPASGCPSRTNYLAGTPGIHSRAPPLIRCARCPTVPRHASHACLAWVNCQVVMPWPITDGVSATAGRDMCTVTRRVARGACSIGRARLGGVEHGGPGVRVGQGQGGWCGAGYSGE